MTENQPCELAKAALLVCNAMRSASVPGTTYFISVNNIFVKIGYTKGETQKRIQELEAGCPFEYELILEIGGGQALESVIHEMFKNQRHKREWFRLEGELLEFINLARDLYAATDLRYSTKARRQEEEEILYEIQP